MARYSRLLSILLACGLVALGITWLAPYGRADDPEPEAPAAPPADPDALRIHLMDGSQISGRLATSDLAVETEFGKLTIPIVSIRSLTPGLGSHPKIEQSITELIEKLGSPVFGEREAAQKSLLEMGPAIRLQLERVVNDPDTERKTRVKAILDEFDQIEEEAANDESQGVKRMIEHDTIETNLFTIVGKVVQQEFEIVSRYGPLNVKLSDIRRVERELAVKEDVQKTITVAGNHIIHRGLKDTGIRVERGDKITFNADGSIQMTPWGNQAVSTPDGAPNYGWYIPNQIAGGALVGRIGANGQVFRIGSKHTMTADRAGELQLAVGMQGDYANQQFPGEYRVKIRVKPK